MTQPAPPLPSPVQIATNGITLSVFEAGQPNSAPTVVLCHGFPEMAYSWRHQFAALAAAGFHVLAPDQRGYGSSDAPEAVEAYGVDVLTSDLIGLLDARGLEKAVFAGHDWGGLLIWALPLLHPDRVAGLIGVNTPFIPTLREDPITLFRQVYGEDMYIVWFQNRDLPEHVFEADLERTMRYFMRLPDPDSDAFRMRTPERKSLALQEGLKHYKQENDTRQFLSPEELAVYVDGFGRSGFRGPINWYRNMSRNWHMLGAYRQHVPHPSLMVTAELDLVLPPSMADGMHTYVPDLERVMIHGSGHWTQQEKPEALNAAMIDWLNRRFRA
jgi:pimeloyl-ACP methyl ester carboxylesterase